MQPAVLKINVKRMRRNYPSATLIQIGKRYGVTRERVRQILKAAGKPTRAVGTLCFNIPNQRFCLNCGRVRLSRGQRTFCSYKCKKEYLTIEVACTQCGVLFSLYQSRVIERLKHSKNIFCSHACSGRYYRFKSFRT